MSKTNKKNKLENIEKPLPVSRLDQLSLADGKAQIDPDIERVKNLEEILGIRKLNPFGTTKFEIFQEMLKDMTMVDMQNMCEKIGIFASGSRQQIKEKLFREFRTSQKGSISLVIENTSFKLDPANPAHKEAIRLLKDRF